MTSPIDRVLDALTDHGCSPRRNGSSSTAKCPAHEDREPSLSVGVGDDGRALLTCHAGCKLEDVLGELGLEMSDLFADGGNRRFDGGPVVKYEYRNENGTLLYVVERHAGKRFRQWRPVDGKKVWKLGDVERVPYRLPEVLEGVRAGRWVVVVEGEKDVHNLEGVGIVATCNAGGAGKWRREWAAWFEEAKVAIIPDNDTVGRDHADQVARTLTSVAEVVKVLELDGLPEHGDVTDWLRSHDGDELKQLIVDAPPWQPSSAGAPEQTETDDEGDESPGALSQGDTGATAQPPAPEPVTAPALAREQAILDRFRDEVRLRGLVGEERNAATLYLVLTSRLLDQQVSAGVKGHSASGKSWTVDTVTEFFPDDAVVEFTAMSQRALVYSKEDFRHRTLVIYEVVALREGVEDDLTSYLVRSLLSEGQIRYEVSVRDPAGGFTTKTITKEGPTNLIFTTTKTRVHAENETRVLSLNTDDTKDQTRRVFLELADERTGRPDFSEWHQLQRWLTTADTQVSIPYARRLAELIPPVAIRLRRDFGSLLALIRTHAVVHQLNRDRDDSGRIVATVDDYAAVCDLVGDTIAAGVEQTVPKAVRETVQAVADLAGSTEGGVTARAVAGRLDVDKSNASRRLRMAADGGWVRNLEDRRGKPGRWVIGDPLPEDVALLPPVDSLTATGLTAETGENPPDPPTGCAVAADPPGERGDHDETTRLLEDELDGTVEETR